MPSPEQIERSDIGSHLRVLSTWVSERTLEDVRAQGFDDLGRAHVQLFRQPSMDGQRPTDVARTVRITKQSVNELLAHLEHHGYLTRDVDPDDNRARIVRFTRRGHAAQRAATDAARDAERELAKLLGNQRFRRLRADLDELVRLTEIESLAPAPGYAGVRSSASSAASK